MKNRALFVICLILASVSAFAYTGSYLVSPVATPGPGSTTPYQEKLDTRDVNPDRIEFNGFYVYAVTIKTHTGVKGNIVLLEESQGGQNTWSFNVPQKIQNELDWATIEFWAPDQDELLIWHDHQGQDPYQEIATRVSPELSDGNGNVLWSITVNSFSSFYENPPVPNTSVPVVPIVALLSLTAISCYFVQRK